MSLRKLDLSYNQIAVVDEISLQRLDILKTIINSNSVIQNDEGEISIRGNPIICNCENRYYLNWVIQQSQSESCLLDGENKVVTVFILGYAYFLCKEIFVLVVFAVLAFVELAFVLLFIYVIVNSRKGTLLKRKIQRGKEACRKRIKNKRTPPVFLSFCSADDEIVVKEIIPYLNVGLQKLLNTDCNCVGTGYDNIRPGFSLANEIIRCIEESAVVIFFITNVFLKKLWCRNEVLIALYENKPTILLIWEELDLTLMPKYLFLYYQNHARVHWIHENGQHIIKPGWDKLCEAVLIHCAES